MKGGWNQCHYNFDAIFFQCLIHVFYNVVIVLNAAFKMSLHINYFFILLNYIKNTFLMKD